jgi:hypothetical protein
MNAADAVAPRKRFAQIGFITIGLPFAIFKLIFGIALLRLLPGYSGCISGGVLVMLGLFDLIVNILNSIFMAVRGRALTQVCVLAILFHMLGKKRGSAQHSVFSADFGTAVDTMLSFSLVAIAVALNLFAQFGENERLLWNWSVVTNVLGAGISRILVTVTPARQA